MNIIELVNSANYNLQFLESDYKCPASDDCISYAKNFMKYSGINKDIIDSMNIHYQIGMLSKDEMYNILFNNDNIIVTYSMYTQGSDTLFFNYMNKVALNKGENLIYLDTSGLLPKLLNNRLKDERNAFNIACGINSNKIYSFNTDELQFNRVKIELNGLYQNYVKLYNE